MGGSTSNGARDEDGCQCGCNNEDGGCTAYDGCGQPAVVLAVVHERGVFKSECENQPTL